MSSAYRLTFTANTRDAGCRADIFLTRCVRDKTDGQQPFSRARLKTLMQTGAVQLNRCPCRAATRIKAGDMIAMTVPALAPCPVAPIPMELQVLFEDNDLLVINKPSGLVVHPGAGTHASPTLVHGLLAHCADLSGIGGVARPGIVHRLDRGTSGALVVAKNDRTHASLAQQFSQRTIIKRYIAVVLGSPAVATATLETPYGRHPVHRQRYTTRPRQRVRRALTSYSTRCSAGGLCVLDVLLGTGRTHQIRVHFADLGHPVVGDSLYGGCQPKRVTDPALRARAQALPHHALHAHALSFVHPRTGVVVAVEAPLFPQFLTLVEGIVTSIAK